MSSIRNKYGTRLISLPNQGEIYVLKSGNLLSMGSSHDSRIFCVKLTTCCLHCLGRWAAGSYTPNPALTSRQPWLINRAWLSNKKRLGKRFSILRDSKCQSWGTLLAAQGRGSDGLVEWSSRRISWPGWGEGASRIRPGASKDWLPYWIT